MSGQRVLHATAYRDGTVVCDRVLVTVIRDERLGLAPRERRQMTVRFVHGLEPGFRSQLMQVLHRRGARSRRLAQALDPIELALDGEPPVAARIEPPAVRHVSLEQTDFSLGSHIRPVRSSDPQGRRAGGR
jgi:hypothetical protein